MEETWKDPSKPDGAYNAHRDACDACQLSATPYDANKRCALGKLLFRRWWHWANTGEDLPVERFDFQDDV